MISPAGIRELEMLSMRALPALETELFDGWVLRATGGYTGRANSVAPLDSGELDPPEKIAFTEAWYRSRSLPPMIRLTPVAQPPHLESFLEERGWRLRDEGVSVQIRKLDGIVSPTAKVHITEGPPPDGWLVALAGFQPTVEEHFASVRTSLSRLPATSASGTINHDETPAAVGRAVLEDGHIGLFDIFTRPDLRNRGLAGDVTNALLGWGILQGASIAYLQVVPSNEAACRLYAGLGFHEAYRYWYRVAPD